MEFEKLDLREETLLIIENLVLGSNNIFKNYPPIKEAFTK